MKLVILAVVGLAAVLAPSAAQTNLAQGASASASSFLDPYVPAQAIDGQISDASRWVSARDRTDPQWLEVHFPKEARVGGIHLFSGYGAGKPVRNFVVQFKRGDDWFDVPSARVKGNDKVALAIPFDETVDVTTTAIRILAEEPDNDIARIKELKIWPHHADGIPDLGDHETVPNSRSEIPRIYLNQSGFNFGQPKRFTAPLTPDGTPFLVREKDATQALFTGTVVGNVGDFSDFDPDSEAEFVVQTDDSTSVPFRIGPWWLERVTYQGMIDFMVDSRHYVGNFTEPCVGSFGWRDDHAFAWELTTLVPQWLSNPSAYTRMPHQIETVAPRKDKGGQPLWGTLDPPDESAPDIVKLIHWGADIIVTQKLQHMFFKEQLAFFLYAWPSLESWLPRQNYDAVKTYATAVWSQPAIGREYPYDSITEDHDLFKVKTEIGGAKGENPPGHSVLPNLLMSSVARRDGDTNADAYFQAARDQVEWMIANLDWNDPNTTKGQRQSEHVTITGLALMARLFPDQAPAGLKKKIADWADVMVQRSENLWDFRRISDDAWVPVKANSPNHWNEPGNVLGFPAALLAAMPLIEDPTTHQRMKQLVWSHFDNAFGRNPSGRHFSYDAPREIEGVELGWYSFYPSGIGQLKNARFVFDGSPKDRHYPYRPEVGNFGWTEGWVNFNTAFNVSMAYLANSETGIEASWDAGQLKVRLRAPLNFDDTKRETGTVRVLLANDKEIEMEVTEDAPSSETLSGELPLPERPKSVAYGSGYFERRAEIR